MGRSRRGTVVSALVGIALLASSGWGLAIPYSVVDVDSSTHPSPATWYAADDVTLDWSLGRRVESRSALDLVNAAGGIVFSGDTGFAVAGSRFFSFDISEASAPSVTATLSLGATVYDLEVAGDTAYVAGGTGGMIVVDVSDPHAPSIVTAHDNDQRLVSVDAEGDLLYCANAFNGMLVLDVSDPSNPTTVSLTTHGSSSNDVTVQGDLAYFCGGGSGLIIYDVTDPSAPETLTAVGVPHVPYDVTIDGTYAYIAGGVGAYVADVQDPAAASIVATLTPASSHNSVAVDGDFLYLIKSDGAVIMYDISDPTAPVELARNEESRYDGVQVVGPHVYAGDQDGLRTYQAWTMGPFAHVASATLGNYGREVVVYGDTLLTCEMYSGVRAVDISDPTAPVVGAVENTPGNSLDMTVDGHIAYVADAVHGVASVDISDPSDPTYLGSIDTSGLVQSVTVDGDYAYVADDSYLSAPAALVVLDVSEPGTMSVVASIETTGDPDGVAIAGDHAYVSCTTQGIEVFDISDPTAPTPVEWYDTTYAREAVALGDHLYIADGSGGMRILGIEDPAALYEVSRLVLTDSTRDIEVVGDTVLLSGDGGNLWVVDATEPTTPRLLGTLEFSDDAFGLDVAGSYAYAATWGDRVEVVSLEQPGGYSYTLDQVTDTIPDTTIDTTATTASFADVADGEWWFHVRAQDGEGDWTLPVHRRVRVDTQAPTTTDDINSPYYGQASITLAATDAGSGVDATYYDLDGAPTATYTGPIMVAGIGEHTISYWSEDALGARETPTAEVFTVLSDGADITRLAGSDRYATAVEISQEAFPGGADTVLVATGVNWPDALGGAALAGAHNGPILLTAPGSLPGSVAAEIDRLGASRVIILGGTGAVSDDVRDSLLALSDVATVERLGGSDRYATARLVAQAAIAELGAGWDGTAFVATGGNFPDALAGSPLAAAQGWPIYLARPGSTSVAGQLEADGAGRAIVLGGTGAVAAEVETALQGAFGVSNVARLAGSDRYHTGAVIASYGVDTVGLQWDGLAVATGENFPDALAGGVLPGINGSVMMLTRSASLAGHVDTRLSDNRSWIASAYILGGEGAVSAGVQTSMADTLE